MKRFLLLATLFMVFNTVNAQQEANYKFPSVVIDPSLITNVRPQGLNNPKAFKTQSTVETWYNFSASLDDYRGGALTGFSPPLFLDNTVKYVTKDKNGNTIADSIRYNSLGASFNPAEDLFDADQDGATATLSRWNTWSCDSFAIPYWYHREVDTVAGQAVVDTLIIQAFDKSEHWYNQISGDTIFKFATVEYDINTNLAKTGVGLPKQTIKYELTAKDTITYGQGKGFGIQNFALNGFKMGASSNICVVYTFKSGLAHNSGDTIASFVDGVTATKKLNYFRGYILVDNPSPSQYHNVTHNNGLLINYQQVKNPNWIMSPTRTARYLSGSGWLSPQYPSVYFHIKSDNVGINENNKINGYALGGAYPNPSNGNVTIEFALGKAGTTQIDVYNSVGQKVSTVASGNFAVGNNQVTFNTENFKAGVYLYTINANGFKQTKSFVVAK